MFETMKVKHGPIVQSSLSPYKNDVATSHPDNDECWRKYALSWSKLHYGLFQKHFQFLTARAISVAFSFSERK